MKKLSDQSGNELRWVWPKGQRNVYELRAGGDVFATVHWKGYPSASALVESANGAWMITQIGLTRTITIKETSSQADVATIKCGISGNVTLLFSDGREFRWRWTSFWRSIRTWVDTGDRPLLHLKRGGVVQLETAAPDLPELALLLALGWYLSKQQQEEAAFVATAIPPPTA